MKLIPMRGLVRVWFSHMESIWRDNERWWFAKYVCHIIDTPSWCHHVTPTLNLDTKPPHEKTECNWVSSQKKWQYIKNWIQVCHSAVSVPLFVTLHCIAFHCIILLSLVRECQCSLYLSHCIALLYCPICDENIRGVSAVSICDSWQEKHARGGSATWEPTKVQSYCQFHHHQHHHCRNRCNFASIIHNDCYNCEYCISANSNPTPIQRNWFWSFNPGNFYGVIIIDLWWSFDHACSTIDDDDAI